jgi:type IV pilus modification protein PilV
MRERSTHRSARGLTLAEVAMAMFIIGVGVLSIATVYLQRERTASLTAQQAVAHQLATDMARRIDTQQSSDVRFENAIGVRCATTPGNVLATNSQTKVVNDVACWQERVAAELPGGAGSIALDESTVPPNYAITVSWSQPRGGLASYTVRTVARIAPVAPLPVNAAPASTTSTGTPNSAPKPNAARAAN